MKLKNARKKIDYILDHFEFEDVAKAMKVLGWIWYNADESPSTPELRKAARGVLWSAARNGFCGLGGFEAEVKGKIITLRFVVSEQNSEYYNEDS